VKTTNPSATSGEMPLLTGTPHPEKISIFVKYIFLRIHKKPIV